MTEREILDRMIYSLTACGNMSDVVMVIIRVLDLLENPACCHEPGREHINNLDDLHTFVAKNIAKEGVW